MAEQSDPQNPTWAELLGSNNCEGLLHPLDLSLRKLILRSGDLIYDAFNNDANSRFCGSSRYGKISFLRSMSREPETTSPAGPATSPSPPTTPPPPAAARSTSSGGEPPGITSGSISWARNPTPLHQSWK